MSILQEYEKIREEMGHEKYDAISEYLEKICPKEKQIEYENEIKALEGLSTIKMLNKRVEIEQKYNIVLLSDVLYKRKEWEKFEKWYSDRQKEIKKKRKDIEREAR